MLLLGELNDSQAAGKGQCGLEGQWNMSQKISFEIIPTITQRGGSSGQTLALLTINIIVVPTH